VTFAPWHKAAKITADPLELPSQVFEYVQEVERYQSPLFERFYRLSCLYDPYMLLMSSETGYERDRNVSENVIASNVDTVVGVIASSEVRPRVLLDDGDWTAQRQAARLSWYGEGIAKMLDAHKLASGAFKDAALKGSGLVKVWVDWEAGELRAERVLIDDIIVDESECRAGQLPPQLHHRVFTSKDDIKRDYPDSKAEIDAAQSGSSEGTWTSWAGYRPIEHDQIVVIESWKPCRGKRGTDRYVPGRHSKCIDTHALLDEEYHKPHYPIARMVWSERAIGWYGLGGAERIAGHQRLINKTHWVIDRQLERHANPTTYVRLPDANLTVKTVNRIGSMAVVKSDIPTTVIPPAVSKETYARLDRIRDGAYEEFGISRLAATAKKPGGLDSGAALREYRDQSTVRFAPQERSFERLVLDIILLGIDGAKDLATTEGYEAPVIVKALAKGRKRLRWEDVDVGEVRYQMQAASTLSRTPAGRTQMVLEWAQAGIISQDESRKLLAPFDPLDLDKTMSLYTAALDNIDLTIEEMLDGGHSVPEPFQNLSIGVWRTQQAYLRAKGDSAPEAVLETLRQWTVQAAWILSLRAEEQGVMQGAMQGVEQGLGAEEPLALPPAQPQLTAPSAIAPEARQIAGIG
jgi:hypothetical protein